MLKWQSKMLSRPHGVRSMPWRREIVGVVGRYQSALLTRAIKLPSLAICMVRWPNSSTAYRQSPALSVKIATIVPSAWLLNA
jgi:hypothetical protein